MRLTVVIVLMLCLLLGMSIAATHVNISIGHQPLTNPADVTYIDGQAPAELRAGPSSQKHQSDFSFRGDGDRSMDGVRDGYANSNSNNYVYSQGPARLTARGGGARVQFGGSQSSNQQHSEQSARLMDQDRQNQEFERYIQNYHSGPTVETVFESATPSSSQRQKSFSSTSPTSSVSSSSSQGGQSQRLVAIGSQPSQVHTFERQVALSGPTAVPTATLLPPTDDRQVHSAVNHQSSSGYDQSSFDSIGTSYNKQGLGYDDSDVHSQFPPSVDESQNNFGSSGQSFYSGNEQATHFTGSTPAPGYLPSYPRPVVTKTIQIAQPALKAKKYEIRHPAVQKEFYDIEERVVIKPAGTIVVELERPVAKIPKGETVLPLGHPHPAVASAYNTNGAAIVQTMGSADVGNEYGNNQFSQTPVYSSKGVSATDSHYSGHPSIGSTTIASVVTATPSYDASSKDGFVESKLNKQYSGDAQYVTTTERSYTEETQSNDGFFVTTTESNNNYGGQFYGRDEADRRYPSQGVGRVEVKNNGAPGVSTAYAGNKQYNTFSSKASYAPSSTQYQSNFNDNNQFKGEFLSGEFYNHQQGPKPARIQEQPHMHTSAFNGHTTHIIKHEHNIHIPPSQHNIYLGNIGSEKTAQIRTGPRYNDEVAKVLELKPYLRQHTGPMVVYAPSAVHSSTSSFNGRYPQQQNYENERYALPQDDHYQSQALNNPIYSAPYSNMRYHSGQSARYVYGNVPTNTDKSNLVFEGTNTDTSYKSDAPTKTAKTQHQAHIQIQIPHHPQEAHKPIVVSSTISPVAHEDKESRSSHYRESIYFNRGHDAERIPFLDNDQRTNSEYNVERNSNFEVSKPDCNHNSVQNGEFTQNNHDNMQEKSLRLIETGSGGDSISTSATNSNVANLQPGSVDVNLKSATGHVATPGSRVIAATPAPTDAAAASESFHKRRIVVNHPFQTVREVVEHEPITNYHHVQVHEPASPELYHHTAPYFQQQTHGAIRQVETLPSFYHHHSTQTHGNLHYAPVLPLVHVGYHHHG